MPQVNLPSRPQHTKKPSGSQEKLVNSCASQFEQINPNAAGIDLGSGEHWVCVPSERDEVNVRRFSCFTPDLSDG